MNADHNEGGKMLENKNELPTLADFSRDTIDNYGHYESVYLGMIHEINSALMSIIYSYFNLLKNIQEYELKNGEIKEEDIIDYEERISNKTKLIFDQIEFYEQKKIWNRSKDKINQFSESKYQSCFSHSQDLNFLGDFRDLFYFVDILKDFNFRIMDDVEDDQRKLEEIIENQTEKPEKDKNETTQTVIFTAIVTIIILYFLGFLQF